MEKLQVRAACLKAEGVKALSQPMARIIPASVAGLILDLLSLVSDLAAKVEQQNGGNDGQA